MKEINDGREKRQYEQPTCTVVEMDAESIVLTASANLEDYGDGDDYAYAPTPKTHLVNHALVIAFAAVATLTAACSSSEDLPESNSVQTGEKVKITVQASLPTTRTVLSDPNLTGGITQTWAATDGIEVVNNASSTSTAVVFDKTGSESGTSATFTGTLTSPAVNDQLIAFYPKNLTVGYDSSLGYYTSVDVTSQAGTLEDVQNRAVMCAAASYKSDGSTSFGTFTNAMAILRLKLTFPANVKISSVNIRGNNLYTAAKLVPIKSGALNPTWDSESAYMDSNGLTATFASPKDFASGTAGYVYLVAIPQSSDTDLSQLMITAKTSDDTPVYYAASLNAEKVHFDQGKVHTLTANMQEVIYYQGYQSKTAPTDVNGDGALEITSAENLAWMQDNNNMAGTSGKTYRLMKNVVVSATSNWVPIATGTTPFQGTFDGNGKTVMGFQDNRSDYQQYGFFGYIDGATVKNLTIKGYGIDNLPTNGLYSGGIAGYATNSSFLGCKSVLSVMNCELSGSTMGGICGTANNCSFYGCTSEVSDYQYMGTSTSTARIGGIAGEVVGCTIMTCMVKSNYMRTMMSQPDVFIGGIFGKDVSTTSPCTVKGCIVNCSNYGGSSANTGGLFGSVVAATYNLTYYAQCYYFAAIVSGAVGTATTVTEIPTVTVALGAFNGYVPLMNDVTNANTADTYIFQATSGDGMPIIVSK